MNQPNQPKSSTENSSLIADLSADLATASEQLDRAASEHEAMLDDPDTNQEDRDASAQFLAEARAGVDRIETALERVEAGTYGQCEQCGSVIPAERLAALPDASTCVSCA